MGTRPTLTTARLRAFEALVGERDYEAIRVKNRDRLGSTDPTRCKTVGIVGGGTAGFLTALALRAQLPDLQVTLIESSSIPIIGVGEATTTPFIKFLHRFLEIDVEDFYAKVQPTWKQGIKFVWGQPGDYHFQAPFDWASNNIGILGSLGEDHNINSMTVESLLMEHDVAPVFKLGRRYSSLLHKIPFAYHLDNRRLVKYLHAVAIRAGVRYLDRKIAHVVRSEDGERVEHLVTTDQEHLEFDLYIDCSGFRSLLIEHTLESPYVSYANSLFTDRALVFNAPHGGRIKPYTTAHTMPNGWTWIIPQVDEDHMGYVYSSAFCSDDDARREAREMFPMTSEPHNAVKFRSGRHEHAWKGNVVAIGNSYAFVEPLESTGLMMITLAIRGLIEQFPLSKFDPHASEMRRTISEAKRQAFNASQARSWDALRWFLSIHYKFNNRLSTKFWQAARAETNTSGILRILDAFRQTAPLKYLDRGVLAMADIPFYGVEGVDCILLGQNVPTRLLESAKSPRAWRQHKRDALSVIANALPVRDALRVVHEHPEFLHQVLNDPDGWVKQSAL